MGNAAPPAEGEGIMGISMLRATGRLLVPVAAVGLLAGASADAATYGSQGQIRLQHGGGQTSQFVYLDASGTALAWQGFKVKPGTKCFLGWANGADDLVNFEAIGPMDSSPTQLGMGPDSIGVYDNSKGVSCYRMTGSIQEGIDLELSPDSEDLPAGLYFDRLELDVEVKQNAELFLEIYKGTTLLETYTLRSGNRVLGDGTAGESDSENAVFNCGADSDSGPDSGASDNCRWIINDIGNRFRLYPNPETDSEVSLEGGGDFADPMANNTVIFLTKLMDTGDLYCSPNTDPALDNKTEEVGGGPVASCQTTRINPNNLPGQDGICQGPITYDLETFLGESRCELRKTSPEAVQLAGSIQITFKRELSVEWATEPTKVTFATDVGQTDPVSVYRCEGTRVQDVNGNWTIEEVLSPTQPLTGTIMDDHFIATVGGGLDVLSDSTDEVPGNQVIDWACVLNDTTEYVGDGELQVTQTILYWGDIAWTRN